ncbi:hypothetical protein PV416_31425 [Streptomyces ipomoeae]|jgi:hypothetical protein|uniref:Lipoprotein n=1 Tax=Streptomyces ipomoeae 91-03 TaxID=698759 RepID=L1KJJ9_9ACTN|nr:hypothetical protein [Streptomyces ipomoeae]EKX60563.1 hypothetical protein STRIP9103_04968 [Streptomyces ipomoeae 91-03]MDX2698699.1 hypothetical protein [Streptomyces ipomoeae]MDX2825466.1 hypothetical protein [Streptomyces ipomoeae]MDX2842920.1 hypothetical protein [Streptomyces ipomoeae]MDX2876896.1 hypothetical protein [Streptomyces ipomoeae]
MPTLARIPQAVALTVLPLALFAGTASAGTASGAGTASVAASTSSKAVFVLDADSGVFGTTSSKSATASSNSSSASVKNQVTAGTTYIGEAADSQILTAGEQRVIADITLASSPNKAERAAWAASSKFVDLSWPDLGASSYTVYRNGVKIADTAAHSLRDTGVTAGSQAEYKIFGVADGLGHTWGLTATVPKNDSPETLAATASQIETKAKKYTKTVVTWRSFIRQKWATVPKKLGSVSGCKYTTGYKYAGDNRGFSKAVSGTSFRAGVRGVVYWTKSQYELYPQTGWTKVYNAKTGKFVEKRKASTKKIDFRTMTRFDGKTRAVRGTIEATDPFCPKTGVKRAGIGVTYDARLARNGDFYVSGKYRKAPDHEMYLFGYTSNTKHSTKVVHQSKMSNLLCLSQPMCERGTIGNSGGY